MAQVTIQADGSQARSVPLKEAVTTIGRSVDNVLEVPDPNMSRRHCVIERREDGEFWLTDCNSSNGTRLNGQRVTTHELRIGDRIGVGSTTLVFELEPGEREGSALAMLEDSNPVPRHLKPAVDTTAGTRVLSKSEPEVVVLTHERDDLRKLLEINKRLNQEHDLRKLLETIIDSAIELMAAERGFLILVHEGEMKVEIARNMSREQVNPTSTKQVSTHICREVIETARPLLTTNAAADVRYGLYQSVADLKLHSILCVPFKIKEIVLGTVYLDNANVGAFSGRDAEVLSAFSDQAAVAIENARLLRQARKKERMEQELRIASEIQKKLLPRKIPEIQGLELHGFMQPAKHVGGDYYDFIAVPGGVLICVGDVSGKGVPAGLVMASARSALRSLAERVLSTKEILVALNRLLAEDLDREMFVSLVLLRYDAATGRLAYTGAGHEHLIVHRARSGRVETRKSGGIVLGLLPDIADQVTEESLDLEPGDTLVLYTDGVTEGTNEQGEMFELRRLEDSVKAYGSRTAIEMVLGVAEDLGQFRGKAQQRDDVTLVAVKRTARPT